MPYTIQQLDDMPAPTVLVGISEPFEVGRDNLLALGEINDLLPKIEGDEIYLIVDLAEMKMDLGMLMQGFAAAFLPHDSVETDHVFASRVRMMMIGSGSLMQFAVKAAGQDQYGNHKLELFGSLDEALPYIRQAVKS